MPMKCNSFITWSKSFKMHHSRKMHRLVVVVGFSSQQLNLIERFVDAFLFIPILQYTFFFFYIVDSFSLTVLNWHISLGVSYSESNVLFHDDYDRCNQIKTQIHQIICFIESATAWYSWACFCASTMIKEKSSIWQSTNDSSRES